jgi:Phosphatidylinositol 3- and 4-kinase
MNEGGDDMRQDAVMQQVFQHVNHTLEKDDDTRKRALCIRTYKVIPTTPQTGTMLPCPALPCPAQRKFETCAHLEKAFK